MKTSLYLSRCIKYLLVPVSLGSAIALADFPYYQDEGRNVLNVDKTTEDVVIQSVYGTASDPDHNTSLELNQNVSLTTGTMTLRQWSYSANFTSYGNLSITGKLTMETNGSAGGAGNEFAIYGGKAYINSIDFGNSYGTDRNFVVFAAGDITVGTISGGASSQLTLG